ncbi:hypothetical protein [Streptomyces sp. NBC_01006]|nr:hypothetical protein OG509_38685 [Streptomyces sp. NBC_01006]
MKLRQAATFLATAALTATTLLGNGFVGEFQERLLLSGRSTRFH